MVVPFCTASKTWRGGCITESLTARNQVSEVCQVHPPPIPTPGPIATHTVAGDPKPSLGTGLQGLGEAGTHPPSMICQGFVCACPHVGIGARLDRDGGSGQPSGPAEAIGAVPELLPQETGLPASASNCINYWFVNPRGSGEKKVFADTTNRDRKFLSNMTLPILWRCRPQP